MSRIMIFILLFLPQTACAAAKVNFVGTWIMISHQTITVINYKNDGIFSGTYFTPCFDVKTTFSGKWQISKDELILNYTESSSSVMRVPFQDRNRIIIRDKDTFLLKTLPDGIQVEAKRVKFKDRKEVFPDWGK
jgi:hypothetical protein